MLTLRTENTQSQRRRSWLVGRLAGRGLPGPGMTHVLVLVGGMPGDTRWKRAVRVQDETRR